MFTIYKFSTYVWVMHRIIYNGDIEIVLRLLLRSSFVMPCSSFIVLWADLHKVEESGFCLHLETVFRYARCMHISIKSLSAMFKFTEKWIREIYQTLILLCDNALCVVCVVCKQVNMCSLSAFCALYDIFCFSFLFFTCRTWIAYFHYPFSCWLSDWLYPLNTGFLWMHWYDVYVLAWAQCAKWGKGEQITWLRSIRGWTFCQFRKYWKFRFHRSVSIESIFFFLFHSFVLIETQF